MLDPDGRRASSSVHLSAKWTCGKRDFPTDGYSWLVPEQTMLSCAMLTGRFGLARFATSKSSITHVTSPSPLRERSSGFEPSPNTPPLMCRENKERRHCMCIYIKFRSCVWACLSEREKPSAWCALMPPRYVWVLSRVCIHATVFVYIRIRVYKQHPELRRLWMSMFWGGFQEGTGWQERKANNAISWPRRACH